jgi:hypothetical protein
MAASVLFERAKNASSLVSTNWVPRGDGYHPPHFNNSEAIMKGENSRLGQGRKMLREMTAEERQQREREAVAEREKLRKERAINR